MFATCRKIKKGKYMDKNLEQIISLFQNSTSNVEITDKQFNLLWKNNDLNSTSFFAKGSVLYDLYDKQQIILDIKSKGSISLSAFSFPHNQASVSVVEIGDFFVAFYANSAKDVRMLENLDGIDIFSAITREDTTDLFIRTARISNIIEDKQTSEDIDEIMRTGYKILKRSQDAVMFSRVTTGSLVLNKKMIDLSSLMSSLCEAAKIIVDLPIKIRCFVPEKSIPVFVDRELVEHAIIAVLLNSYKYTRDDNEIKVTLREKGTNAVITITDKGAGIKPENLKQIFRPYFSTSPYSEQGELRPGLGIGLSIAVAVARLHGGTLVVSSEFGVGTKVVMTVPLLDRTRDDGILKSNSANYVTNKFSTTFIGFSEICRIPH